MRARSRPRIAVCSACNPHHPHGARTTDDRAASFIFISHGVDGYTVARLFSTETPTNPLPPLASTRLRSSAIMSSEYFSTPFYTTCFSPVSAMSLYYILFLARRARTYDNGRRTAVRRQNGNRDHVSSCDTPSGRSSDAVVGPHVHTAYVTRVGQRPCSTCRRVCVPFTCFARIVRFYFNSFFFFSHIFVIITRPMITG